MAVAGRPGCYTLAGVVLMSPLSRLPGRFLPSALRVPVLVLIYAGMICAIVVASSHEQDKIAYLDVRGQ